MTNAVVDFRASGRSDGPRGSDVEGLGRVHIIHVEDRVITATVWADDDSSRPPDGLLLNLLQGASGFLVEDGLTETYGHGRDANEALEDFVTALFEAQAVLRSDEASLTPRLRTRLASIDRIIERVDAG